MFNIKNVTLEDFNSVVGFWSGALDRWNDMTDEEKEYLEEVAEGMTFDTLTQVNDFIWFDSDELLEELREQKRFAKKCEEEDESEEVVKEEIINCLVVRNVDGEIQLTREKLHNDLHSLQEVVGGLIEPFYPLDDNKTIFVCNEEGKYTLAGQPTLNWFWEGKLYDVIMGTVFICTEDTEGNFASLSPAEMDIIERELRGGANVRLYE